MFKDDMNQREPTVDAHVLTARIPTYDTVPNECWMGQFDPRGLVIDYRLMTGTSTKEVPFKACSFAASPSLRRA